ncbi:MAG: nucleoside hydrolase [Clostridia bacterium]|nr:nucleoside hydrolase [Clostridia bacterium]
MNSGKSLIIFDTDIGGDCDDAGALALCHALCDLDEASLLAVTCCYATPYVAGCVDAINKYYGRSVPVGVNYDREYLSEIKYCDGYFGYDRPICELFPNDYKVYAGIPDSLEVLRKTLADSEDDSVTLVATGYLSSFAKLILSDADEFSPLSGRELIAKKVRQTVVMGGRFFEGWPGDYLYAGAPVVTEYNIRSDIKAAQCVCDNWPGKLIFSSFEIGTACMSLKYFHRLADKNPAAMSYKLHPSASVSGRESWDLTAMLQAIRPDRGYWKLSACGKINVSDEGVTSFEADETGKHYFLLPDAPESVIRDTMESLIYNCSR